MYTEVLDKAITQVQINLENGKRLGMSLTRWNELENLVEKLKELRGSVEIIENTEGMSFLLVSLQVKGIKEKLDNLHVKYCEAANMIHQLENNDVFTKTTMERLRKLLNEP